MNFTEMTAAVADAQATLSRADKFADDMARMLVGRLRGSRINSYTLERLKRELRDFNIHTNKWRN